jgi:VIT1/CCC1 family predicted Fe2+/Mn2+ transporter
MMQFIRRYLDPSACMAELLFGVIMTLTFTLGAGLVIEEGPDATRELLIGVIGCNIAWGVIDGLLYIFGAMYERGLGYRASSLMAKLGRGAAAAKLDQHLEDNYGAALSAETRGAVREELIEHLAAMKPARVKMTKDDAFGALASFILVVLTAVPAVLPFMFFDERMLALRVSNILLVGLISLIGWQWASCINANRGHIALGMAVGGLVLVQITITLGG